MRLRVALICLIAACASAGWCLPSLTGFAEPQAVTVAAGQQVGVSYLIRNLTAQQLTIVTSTADFVVGGVTVATVALPVNTVIRAHGSAIIPSNVSISQQVANAARTARTDQVVVNRTFTCAPVPPAGGAPSVIVPVAVRIGSSLAGPVSVTEILLDAPQNGRTVGLSEEIRGHAFIRGTGTGAIVGAWYVDNQPTETFQVNMTAGFTKEVRTRLTLPTTQLGPHNVTLQITRPAPVSSNTQSYMVVSGGDSNHTISVTAPADEISFTPASAHTDFRWLPMPGAAGYEIAFAKDLADLGLDAKGKPISPLLAAQAWDRGKLICLAKLPSDASSFTPSDDEFARLASSPTGKVVWAVRAIYPAQDHGDPSTTSKPHTLNLPPKPTALGAPTSSTTAPTHSSPLALSRRPQEAVSKGGAVLFAGNLIGALPGATSELTLSPADGASITNQQPVISATYPEAKSAMLTLNGVDVTALADVKPTGLTLPPPGVFNAGSHTVGLTIETTDGRTLESTSKFTITPESQPGHALESLPNIPLQLNLDWNWDTNTNTAANDALTIDANIRGQHSWPGANAALNAQLTRPIGEKMDLSSFIATGATSNGAYKAMAGDVGSDGSEFTTQGSTYRALNLTSDAGPVKVSVAHTLGQTLQMSSTGSAPDMFLMTAESAKSTADKNFRMSYVDSSTNNSSTSGFDGQTKSKVISLGGCAPIGKTGLNATAELARSDSTFSSTLGTQSQTDNAVNASLGGTFAGIGLSTTYQMVGSGYASPGSSTLTSNIRGWTFAASRPFGQYLTAGLNYSLLDNAANSSAPSSSLISKSLDIALTYPNLPVITLQFARNDASADPFTNGTTGSHTQDSTWSIGANYAKSIWDTYLNYSRSSFTDFLDFFNPLTDTPNDTASGTWAYGFGVNPTSALRLRFDWGANDCNRWFRPQFSPNAISGTDTADQFRAQLDYLISTKLSSTLTLSNSDYADALGTFYSNTRNLSFRVNYLLRAGKNGGGLTLTGELLHSDFLGAAFGDNGNTYSILVNDNRLMSF